METAFCIRGAGWQRRGGQRGGEDEVSELTGGQTFYGPLRPREDLLL